MGGLRDVWEWGVVLNLLFTKPEEEIRCVFDKILMIIKG